MRELFLSIFCIATLLPGLVWAEPENPLKRFNHPKVIFTFDDVYQSVYELALPVLNAHKMPATVYVATKWASDENPLYMKWPALQDVASNYGWEIGGHTVNHPELEVMKSEEIEEEVRGSKDALMAHGFNPVSFAVPYGSYNNEALGIIHKYYENNRGFWTADPLGQNELRDQLNLSAKRIENVTSVEEIKGWVDQAIAGSKTLILVFHVISHDSPAGYRWAFGLEQFRNVVDYVASKQDLGQVEVTTVQKAVHVEGQPILKVSKKEQPHFYSTQDQLSDIFFPEIKVDSSKAYLLKVFIDAKGVKADRKLRLFVQETDLQGRKRNRFFVETEPACFLLSQTYTPTPDVASARLVIDVPEGSSGPLVWDNFSAVERIPEKN